MYVGPSYYLVILQSLFFWDFFFKVNKYFYKASKIHNLYLNYKINYSFMKLRQLY
jgi:hypothetical protein